MMCQSISLICIIHVLLCYVLLCCVFRVRVSIIIFLFSCFLKLNRSPCHTSFHHPPPPPPPLSPISFIASSLQVYFLSPSLRPSISVSYLVLYPLSFFLLSYKYTPPPRPQYSNVVHCFHCSFTSIRIEACTDKTNS